MQHLAPRIISGLSLQLKDVCMHVGSEYLARLLFSERQKRQWFMHAMFEELLRPRSMKTATNIVSPSKSNHFFERLTGTLRPRSRGFALSLTLKTFYGSIKEILR